VEFIESQIASQVGCGSEEVLLRQGRLTPLQCIIW